MASTSLGTLIFGWVILKVFFIVIPIGAVRVVNTELQLIP
jgi:hypothetical protein